MLFEQKNSCSKNKKVSGPEKSVRAAYDEESFNKCSRRPLMAAITLRNTLAGSNELPQIDLRFVIRMLPSNSCQGGKLLELIDICFSFAILTKISLMYIDNLKHFLIHFAYGLVISISN